MSNETTPDKYHLATDKLSAENISAGLLELYPYRYTPELPDFPLFLENMRLLLGENATFKDPNYQDWEASLQEKTINPRFLEKIGMPFTPPPSFLEGKVNDSQLTLDQTIMRMRFLHKVYHTNPTLWLDWVREHVYEEMAWHEVRRTHEQKIERIDGDIRRRLGQ